MSSRKSPIIFSPEAQKDFIGILRYTAEQWGNEQLLNYRSKLDDALILLSKNSHIGRTDPTLLDTHSLYFVGAHVIIYRTRNDIIEIVRILHQRMSIQQNI